MNISPLPVKGGHLLFLREFCAQLEHYEPVQAAFLFGSGAEGNLRLLSDLNVLVVLKYWRPELLTGLAPAVKLGEKSIRLRILWVCSDEWDLVEEAFPIKFLDFRRRHRLLWGHFEFPSRKIPKQWVRSHLHSLLLNLILRLRNAQFHWQANEGYAGPTLAEWVSQLRACAMGLAYLNGQEPLTPKLALVDWAKGQDRFEETISALSRLRVSPHLDPISLAHLAGEVLVVSQQMDRELRGMDCEPI